MFIIEEEADGCCTTDFCCRVCCNPNHPAILKMYVATAPIPQAPCACCGIACSQPADEAMKDGAAFMTFERPGCCVKLPHCWVCCEMCQDEMKIHAGDVGGHSGGGGYQMPGSFGDASVVMLGKVPIGGGGCTPTIELFERQAPGVITAETMDATMGQPFGVVEGPMCFGGCADFCCDTKFTIGNSPGAADVASIIKKKPEDCSGWCRACCTPADTYDLKLTESGKEWAPEKKAMMLANMIHLDYMFFENDKFPVTCEMTEDQTLWITILCCLCYCYGCLIPIQCSIPIKTSKE